ncbi:PCYCGC motif-containing (lipo)protein [Microbacteriaceae bacterium 4G12]
MKKLQTTVLSIVSISCLLFSGGCGTKEKNSTSSHDSHEAMHSAQQEDIAETTKNAKVLPSFLSTSNSKTRKAYETVGQHQELLQWIPCYCGCGQSVGHKSNLNCFIRSTKPSGEIVWDSHATTCANCIEIAVESASLQQQGKSTLEIRKYIDNKYKEGYAKPTPTPMPRS